MAKDCKNVAKVSIVASTFGTGTICGLAPGPEDVAVSDKFEADGEDILTSKVGLPNRMLLNGSYKLEKENQLFHLQRIPLVTGWARIKTSEELPTPHGMY